MAKVSHIQTSFAGGEFGSSLFGRTDIAQYANACQTVENFLIRPYGSAISAPGTEFIGEVKTSANKTRLIPFIFNRTDAYVIEMGDKYFRFYTDNGIVVSPGTTPYQITHIYSTSELFDVQFAQLNDVIYMTHKNHTPQKLTRLGSMSWTIADFAFIGGPFMDDNTDETITITASATSGTGVTLILSSTASTSFVNSSSTMGHIGSFWKVGGVRTDSTTGLEVQGYVKITGVTSATIAVGTVIKTLTTSVATDDWAEGAWCDVNGWPQAVTFHESRLFMARTTVEPQKVWASKPFIYDDFLAGAEDDDALNLQLVSNEANEVNWLVSGKSLIAGTYGGEFTISSGSADAPLTPSNTVANKETSWGSETITPKKIGTFFYYIQRFGKKLRELFYNWDLDAYKSVDKTILSPHIAGDGFKDLTYQQNPETMLYCVTTNGDLAVLTREVDQELQAWARITTDGDFESVVTIPHPTEAYDQLWTIVRRLVTSNSTLTYKRYIEAFKNIIVPNRQDKCWYVHSGLYYDAYEAVSASTVNITLSATAGTSVVVTSSTAWFDINDIGRRIRTIDADGNITGELEITNVTSTTIVVGTVKYTFNSKTTSTVNWGLSVMALSGLDHLEAKTVVVLADGGTDKPDKVVSNGTIALAYDYFVVNVGLPYDQILYTLPIEAGNPQGTAQGKIQKINQIALKVNRSHKGFSVGGDGDELDIVSYIESTTPEKIYTGTIPNPNFILERVSFRDPNTPMGTPEVLYTGIIPNISFRGDYKYGAQIYIKNSDPLPLEILSIMADLTTQE